MAFFKGKKLEQENQQLQQQIAYYQSLMTPELQNLGVLRQQTQALAQQCQQLQMQQQGLVAQNNDLWNQIQEKQKGLADLDEELLVEEFGLYKPTYNFANSTQYKDKLSEVRARQKEIIKRENIKAGNTQWTVNGSSSLGRKAIKNQTKMMFRAFNSECDDRIRKVKTTNIDKTIDFINKSADQFQKLGEVEGVCIPYDYVQLKIAEARLAYEYAVFKEQEKEAIREAKAREREELRVQKEIEAKRKQLRKEQTQYERALEDAKKRYEAADETERQALLEKINELESNLNEVYKGIADVDYREANKRAGFVYIISNIGSFGENVFKIGMTRRLEPMERIYELSDASVPFNFDVHALIFSDDAPGLETALHHEFENRKLNLVNQRREFFQCTLDEIKEAIIKNYDKTVDFIDIPDADQYRISKKMREAQSTKQ